MTSQTIPKTYSLLSIGQRAAGKTVFLAGSYTELHSDRQSDSEALWIECRDERTQENIEALLSYIARSGSYPPPTVKMTNFNFSLKLYDLLNEQTLCHFRWWDIPGESCNFDDPDFRKLVFDSSGCCVFIDADALTRQPDYHQKLQEIRQQVIPIATLIHLNRLKYAFAFLLTKCDLLETDTAISQLQEHLHPLTAELNGLGIDYEMFYLKVPIVTVAGRSTLKASGTAQPLIWLANQLETYHQNTQLIDTAEDPSAQEVVVQGSIRHLVNSAKESRTNRSARKQKANRNSRPNWLIWVLAIAGLVGVGFGWWMYDNLLRRPSPRPVLEQQP